MPDQAPQPAEDDSGGIASALIKARNEQGLTQAELSELSGVSRSAIKGYETGRNMPGARELKALCGTLRVSPTTLLYGSEKAFTDRIGLGQVKRKGDLEYGQARWQLHGTTSLLTVEEIAALLELARAIAVARHGIEAVNTAYAAANSMAFVAASGASVAETYAGIDRFIAALKADKEEEAKSKQRKKPDK